MTHDHDQSHNHSHDHGSELSEMQLRVRALESILLEKEYIDPAALDVLIETYEKKIGPRNGARVVAKAWADPDFRRWLFDDGTAAIESLGYGGRSGNHLVALENTASIRSPARYRATRSACSRPTSLSGGSDVSSRRTGRPCRISISSMGLLRRPICPGSRSLAMRFAARLGEPFINHDGTML